MNYRFITTIGSLPCTDPKNAFDLLLKYTPELITWPQLPKRSFKENMYVQFTEKLPGVIIDENKQKIYIDTKTAYNELEKFYEHYLTNDFDYFSISREYASGFYQLLNYLNIKSTLPVNLVSKSYIGENNNIVKCQLTGPITLGLSLKTETDASVFYDTQLKDVILKLIIMKSLWQMKQIIKTNSEISTIVLFLDEPYLASYGSAYTPITKEDIISSLNEVISIIKNSKDLVKKSNNQNLNILVGIHCCANTDWSIILETGLDILSFDAYEYFDNLMLYIDKLKHFINSDGILAWGIVPSSNKIEMETKESLIKKLEAQFEQLSNKGIDKTKILNKIIITPSCGLGTLSEELAQKILFLTRELFIYLNNKQ